MTRALRRLAAVWLILMLLLAEEIGAAFALPGRIGPGVVLASGLVMVVVVGFAFMRLRSSASLVQAVVVAALFWLLVLLGLGGMDPLTRTDYPVPVTTLP
jgi:caa(3)-type oxidase subunit IV